MMETPRGHLDLLRIDAVRAGEGTREEEAHIESCTRCRKIMNEMSEFAGALAGAASPPPDVPNRVDAAILREYRRRFGAGRRDSFPALPSWRRWFVPGFGAAVAAAAVLAVVLPGLRETRTLPGTPRAVSEAPTATATALPGDLTGDGRLDILDAFLLARSVEGSARRIAQDLDGDGATDRADVDILARRAVALQGRT